MSKKTMINFTLVSILLSISLILGVFVYQQFHQAKHFDPNSLHGTYVPPGRTFIAFHLTDTNNHSFQASNLVGHWSLLFFGFTQCHSICPTTMAELHKMNQILKSNIQTKGIPQVYMISLDPDRDTINSLNQYVKGFDTDFIGALGSKAMIDKLSQHLGIVYDSQPRKDGQIDHSGTITVINPAGEVAAFFTPPLNAQWMADDLVALMHQFVNR
jgi:protein SCO1/2